MDSLFIQRLFGPHQQTALMQLLVVVFSVCLHEYAHARAALWQGDSTAAEQGHLTLNPLKQMGPMSLIMLLIIGIAWGAVPVNPGRMRHRYSDALVSFAGPATNLALFLVSSLLFAFSALLFAKGGSAVALEAFRVAGMSGVMGIAYTNEAPVLFFFLGAMTNMVLFIINMLPVPPFDGFKVFNYLFNGRLVFRSEFAKGAMLLVVLLVLFSGGFLWYAGEMSFMAAGWGIFKALSVFRG